MAHTNPGGSASSNKQQAILYGRQFPTLLTFAVPIICGNLFQSLYKLFNREQPLFGGGLQRLTVSVDINIPQRL